METVIIVQARMTSTRLPGKILKEILDKPLFEYQIERLKRVENADQLVIATTINKTDQPIIDLCNRLGVKYFRGSEEDVLSRYYYAAKEYGADVIVRITSDCPLIDPEVVDRVIRCYLENLKELDYISNTLERTYPRGMDTEVFSFKVLQEAFQEGCLVSEREHVTPFLYNHPQQYRLGSITYHKNESGHRWTVDTIEDFELIKNIIETVYPVNSNFTMEDVLELLNKHLQWVEINNFVEQKQVY